MDTWTRTDHDELGGGGGQRTTGDYSARLPNRHGNRGAAACTRISSLMKQTPAVRQQRYLKLQYAELTPGPANIAAVEKLAHLLYATDVK